MNQSIFSNIKNLKQRFHFEYWPFWAFYFPIFILWPIFSLRGKSLFFFTAANPMIPMGGSIGESKFAILSKLDDPYIPKTLYVDCSHEHSSITEKNLLTQVTEWIKLNNLQFPLILKPDMGERGDHIKIVYQLHEIFSFAGELQRPFIIQEFLKDMFEAGIMFFKDPKSKKISITSIVTKKFLTVTGDGSSSIEMLLEKDIRGKKQLDRLKHYLDVKMVLKKNEAKILEPVGNHKRGTTFINSNNLITAKLESKIEEITAHLDGIYVGRFDLKAPTVDDLIKGHHLKVMELNGVFSEPGHIYDPKESLWKAWRDLIIHWWKIASTCKVLIENGAITPSIKSFYQHYHSYLKTINSSENKINKIFKNIY